jgi:undecaprenyl diphosphate synthase
MSELLVERFEAFRNPPIPDHIALMPDGTRRGSRQKGISFQAGYHRGAERLNEITTYVLERDTGKKTLSFGLVSDDNLSRPPEHLRPLFSVLEDGLGLDELVEKGVKIQVMGNITRDGVPAEVQDRYADLTERSKDNTALDLNLAIGYDGLEDAAVAATRLAQRGDIITKESLGKSVSAGRPPVDLFIRTGKERRLGGFMPLETEFTQLYFADVYWPDFSVRHFKKALRDYGRQQRRFGK